MDNTLTIKYSYLNIIINILLNILNYLNASQRLLATIVCFFFFNQLMSTFYLQLLQRFTQVKESHSVDVCCLSKMHGQMLTHFLSTLSKAWRFWGNICFSPIIYNHVAGRISLHMLVWGHFPSPVCKTRNTIFLVTTSYPISPVQMNMIM